VTFFLTLEHLYYRFSRVERTVQLEQTWGYSGILFCIFLSTILKYIKQHHYRIITDYCIIQTRGDLTATGSFIRSSL
jgi:hypothetical protein